MPIITFEAAVLSKEIKNKVNYVAKHFLEKDDVVILAEVEDALFTLKNEITTEPFKGKFEGENLDSVLSVDHINPRVLLSLHTYVRDVEHHYAEVGNAAQNKMDRTIMLLENSEKYEYDATLFKELYFNENLSNLVRNSDVKFRIVELDNRFIRKVDPIFHKPRAKANPLNYRTHMYAPVKQFLGMEIETFWFNVGVIWSMTIHQTTFLTSFFAEMYSCTSREKHRNR